MPHLCNSARRITVRSTFHHKNFTCLVETRFHTMLCIYIYYITYIYILYFYRVSGIVSGFHNWHKKMAVFWVLESLPILPYPNGISGDRSICWATSRSRDRGSPRQTSYFRTFGHLPKRHSDKATIDTIIVFNGVNWCEMGVQNCLSKIHTAIQY